MKALNWIYKKSYIKDRHEYKKIDTVIEYRFWSGKVSFAMWEKVKKETGLKDSGQVDINGHRISVTFDKKYKSSPNYLKVWISNEPKGEIEMKEKGLTFDDLAA